MSRMPREMVLILKTNDLLRNMEHILGCHGRQDSMLEVSSLAVLYKPYFLDYQMCSTLSSRTSPSSCQILFGIISVTCQSALVATPSTAI